MVLLDRPMGVTISQCCVKLLPENSTYQYAMTIFSGTQNINLFQSFISKLNNEKAYKRHLYRQFKGFYMTTQMVDRFLLSIYLLATYQPFASPSYIYII